LSGAAENVEYRMVIGSLSDDAGVVVVVVSGSEPPGASVVVGAWVVLVVSSASLLLLHAAATRARTLSSTKSLLMILMVGFFLSYLLVLRMVRRSDRYLSDTGSSCVEPCWLPRRRSSVHSAEEESGRNMPLDNRKGDNHGDYSDNRASHHEVPVCLVPSVQRRQTDRQRHRGFISGDE